jgi:hypothetical protein
MEGALLPQTLIDGGGSGLNIIFIVTLKKMQFNFNKLTTCDEPFYGIVPGKAAYPWVESPSLSPLARRITFT